MTIKPILMLIWMFFLPLLWCNTSSVPSFSLTFGYKIRSIGQDHFFCPVKNLLFDSAALQIIIVSYKRYYDTDFTTSACLVCWLQCSDLNLASLCNVFRVAFTLEAQIPVQLSPKPVNFGQCGCKQTALWHRAWPTLGGGLRPDLSGLWHGLIEICMQSWDRELSQPYDVIVKTKLSFPRVTGFHVFYIKRWKSSESSQQMVCYDMTHLMDEQKFYWARWDSKAINVSFHL